MRKPIVWICVVTAAVAAGCTTTRSISNTARTSPTRCFAPARPAEEAYSYRGELNEFDVLAIDRDQIISQADIERALETPAFAKLRRGSSIMLVQSGAVFPDAPMVAALERDFTVVPFSGVPVNAQNYERGAYSRLLRLAAARAGSQSIVCYWGILESGTQDLRTKTVSWVPLAGWMVPDERQHMRIRLKIALIDVKTGAWTVFSPPAFGDKAISTRLSRGSADQKQIESLQQQAYEATARDLVAQYAR